MKSVLLLAAAAMVPLGGVAAAADAIPYEPSPAPQAAAPAVYDWSGIYIGIEGGAVLTNLDIEGVGDEDFKGGMLGGHAGFNLQDGSFVYGVEANIDYAWDKSLYFVGFPLEIGTEWQGSLRARLGYARDRTLIYGTGGLAVTSGMIEGLGLKLDETYTGWTLGGGIEQAFTENWTARIEYRYSDYGGQDYDLGIGNLDLTEHAVRLGVSYKF